MQPGQQIGNYIVDEKLGAGGMGEVWRGRHTILARPVAIKLVTARLSGDAQFVARFRQEARAQANLQHPHIVAVSDFISEGDSCYLIMPLIVGESLEGRLRRQQGPLPLVETLRTAHAILDALDFAHRNGIIHRDVKPANILLASDGHPYLSDFGIALMVGQERFTRGGAAVGTPHYMSPEQIRRPKSIDHRSDVYSFGCVLYEMLTGHPPFDKGIDDGDTDFIVKSGHLTRTPPPPRLNYPDIPPSIEAAVMQALAKEPEARFAGCSVFSRALRQAAPEHAPPLITPATPPPPVIEPKPILTPTLNLTSADKLSSISEPEEQPQTPYLPAAMLDQHRLILGAAGLGVLIVLLVAYYSFRKPASVTVSSGGGEKYTTISAAIGGVRSGGKVIVKPGTYKESILVDRDVEIAGEGPRPNITLECSRGSCLAIKTDHVTVRNLTIRGGEANAGSDVYMIDAGEGGLILENCELSSSSSTALAVHGNATTATVINCLIHDSRAGGIFVFDRASVTVEDSEIARTTLAAVEGKNKARVNLRRCRLHDSRQSGLLLQDSSTGVIEACDIYNNALSGVLIKTGSTPTLKQVKVYTNKQAGLLVSDQGGGIIEDCEIYGNTNAGVEIATGAKPTFRRCRIRDGRKVGVFCRDDGLGTFEGSFIISNAMSGVEISRNANPIFRQCTISRNRQFAVSVRDNGAGLVESCDLTGNGRGAWSIETSARVMESGNRTQ